MNREVMEIKPDVSRIAEGLRDTGYDLNMAIADIIDNSLEAGATKVDVRFGLREDMSLVIGVGDNGKGMGKKELQEAMRYGSKERTSSLGLGKFGLGLKTASTAFCKKLIVVSRSKKGDVHKAIWDLDLLAKENKWNLIVETPSEQELEYLNTVTENSHGTAVIWEKIDRLFTQNESESTLQEQVLRITEELKAHIALVFQRFLDSMDRRAPDVQIFLNDDEVKAWNPLMPILGSSIEKQELNATLNGELIPITIEATILPRPEEVHDGALRAEAKIKTENQGIYVFRENRLIHGPNWLGIFPQEVQHTLLRLTISFDKRMDSAFMVDIKKSRVLINEHLYNWLKHVFLPSSLEAAESRWRQGATQEAALTATERHASSDTAISAHIDDLELPQIIAVYSENNSVRIENKHGLVNAPMVVVNATQGLNTIAPVQTLEHNALYAPALINDNFGIALNMGHSFYTKIYMAHEKNSAIIQGLDMLFFALAQAQNANISPENTADFENTRLELARNLKTLLSFLPEA